jgi:hypothetical protein
MPMAVLLKLGNLTNTTAMVDLLESWSSVTVGLNGPGTPIAHAVLVWTAGADRRCNRGRGRCLRLYSGMVLASAPHTGQVRGCVARLGHCRNYAKGICTGSCRRATPCTRCFGTRTSSLYLAFVFFVA